LARAATHCRDLEEILDPLVQVARDSVVADEGGKPGERTYRVMNVPRIDPAWSTVIGDALFNIRGALDHLACQLVLLVHGQPAEETQFPIHSSRTNDEGSRCIVTIQPKIRSQAIFDALDEVQPYRALDRGQDLWNDTFWLVKTLCDLDKHGLLSVMIHALDPQSRAQWRVGEGLVGWSFNTES
jgi:hypothetical protein